VASESSQTRRYRKRRRAEHEARTRERITEAAVKLHGTVGPARTTVAGVAREAGVQRATVYRHFPDRASLVEGLTARLVAVTGGQRVDLSRLDDLKPLVVRLMHDLEAHYVEARAEALFNADPRRFTAVTRTHTAQFRDLVSSSLPELGEGQQVAIASVLRVLVSAQTWLRMREEFGVTGDASGPIVAWVVDAMTNEVGRGNPPPPAGPSPRGRGT
jgi:AcrR family transcriptional regulator